MNKMISTPFDCARRMFITLLSSHKISYKFSCNFIDLSITDVSKKIGERAVVADVDGQLWDMHRPLETDCTLKLLHFCEVDIATN